MIQLLVELTADYKVQDNTFVQSIKNIDGLKSRFL